MKIGIDARWIFRKLSGIGIYTQELIRHLACIDHENEYILFFNDHMVAERTQQFADLNNAPNFQTVYVSYGPFSPRGQWDLPRLFNFMDLDLFHSTNYMIPLLPFPRNKSRKRSRTLGVVTIHDLIPLILPDHAPKSKKSRLFPIFKCLMHEIGRRADMIIAVSNSSRNDVIQHLRIPNDQQDKVVTIMEAAGEQFVPGNIPREPHTILYVGRLDPYKNVMTLIDAFSDVIKTIPNTTLKLVTHRDARYPEVEQRIQELGLSGSIQWVENVDNQGLVHAYQTARALVLPSQYEGFGLPVLEAMRCGTPVICSNSSSLPEVAGDAALFVESSNVSQLSTTIQKVLADDSLARTLGEKGLQQSKQFNWELTAKKTMDAYCKIYNTNKTNII